MRRRAGTAAVLAVPVAFLAVFFAVPAATIVATGLRTDGAWDLGAVGEVLGSASTRRVAWCSGTPGCVAWRGSRSGRRWCRPP